MFSLLCINKTTTNRYKYLTFNLTVQLLVHLKFLVNLSSL